MEIQVLTEKERILYHNLLRLSGNDYNILDTAISKCVPDKDGVIDIDDLLKYIAEISNKIGSFV